MTPNIASVISSASNANGSAGVSPANRKPPSRSLFPKPTRVERRRNVSHKPSTSIPPHALSSPPPRARIPAPRRAARRFESRAPAPLLCVDFSPLSSSPARGCAHTDATRSHSSVSARIPVPPPPRARLHHPSPTTASSHRVRGRVPARIARHRPRARYRAPRTRGHIARTFTRTVPRTRARDRRLTLRRARPDSSAREPSARAGASFPSTLPAAHQP